MNDGTNTNCSVPVSTLRLSPFNLATNADVYARVTAVNAVGDSTVSSDGNGASIPAA